MAAPDVVARIVERLRQQRQAQREDIAARLEAARRQAVAATGELPIGARVVDTVTGQEGVIVGRTRENVVRAARGG